MENSITYTVEDGTEYRLTYDNETSKGQMHYLLHENGVLKFECTHHALPFDLTEDEFKSVAIPSSFFRCLSKAHEETAQLAELRATGVKALVQLADMATPHIRLTAENIEWLNSVVERGHNLELLVKVMQEAQVEAFSRQLRGNLEFVEADELVEQHSEPRPHVVTGERRSVKAWLDAYWYAIVWALSVVVVVAGAIYLETR